MFNIGLISFVFTTFYSMPCMGQFVTLPTDCFYVAALRTNVQTFCPGTNRRLLIGDYDGDKRNDLLCQNKNTNTVDILYNLFSRRQESTTFCSNTSSFMYTAELNGDNRTDLVCQHESGVLTVMHAAKNSIFTESTLPKHVSMVCHPNNSTLLLGDYDKDGIADMICHSRNDGGFHILFSSNGALVKSTKSFCSGSMKHLYAGNFDKDGGVDVLCHDPNEGKIRLLFSKHMLLKENSEISYEMRKCNSASSFLTIADINGDGYDDIICKQSGLFGRLYIFQNQGNGRFSSEATYKFSFCMNGGKGNFYVGDFNRDGKYDLMCQTSIGTRQINISYCLKENE